MRDRVGRDGCALHGARPLLGHLERPGPTFRVAGHHYALVTVTGLRPGTSPSYEVFLDDAPLWPLPDSRFPSSVIPVARRRRRRPGHLRVVPLGRAPGRRQGRDPDALDALAKRLAADPDARRPGVLLLLGDQVYSDEVSEETRRLLATRRDLDKAPGSQVADYEV